MVPTNPVLFPLHLPLKPQVVDAAITHIPDGSTMPAPTAVQVPAGRPGGLHVSQTPRHALLALQQTPSRVAHARPAAHWVVTVQGPPAPCSPHEPLTQVAGGVQSVACVATVQVLLHVAVPAAATQRPGAQVIIAGALQVPVPLQVDATVTVDALVQFAATH